MYIYTARDDVEVSKVFETQAVCHLSGYHLNYPIINHSQHCLLLPNCKFFQQCQWNSERRSWWWFVQSAYIYEGSSKVIWWHRSCLWPSVGGICAQTAIPNTEAPRTRKKFRKEMSLWIKFYQDLMSTLLWKALKSPPPHFSFCNYSITG